MTGGAAIRSPDQRLGRRQRLTRLVHFEEAYAQGRRGFGRYMVLWLRQGEGAALRLGVVTGRRIGSAVARSRARRRLREVYRRHRHLFRGPFDVVLVARSNIGEASWQDLTRDLLKLAERMGLVPRGAGPQNDE